MTGADQPLSETFMIDHLFVIALNSFAPNAPFLYPLKTSESRKVKKGGLGTNGLK